MQLDNALYAAAQVIHNFGAVAATALPIAVVRLRPATALLPRIAWIALVAWLFQIASGAGFGAVSYFVVGELPEIHNLALAALLVKIACALIALLLVVAILAGPAARAESRGIWTGLAACGSIALFSAAILRWFS
ncbi:MAG TPA: hypothetical protein VK446_15780 [Methylocystis sp.]|nr:hypothetical protein [Methylocystis sp.]